MGIGAEEKAGIRDDSGILLSGEGPFSELRKQSLEVPVSAVATCRSVCGTPLRGPICVAVEATLEGWTGSKEESERSAALIKCTSL